MISMRRFGVVSVVLVALVGPAFAAGQARPASAQADYPFRDIKLSDEARIADLLFDLNREFGTTLVLVTHEIALARRCGRMLTLDAGRLVADTRVAA